ncbi:MAG: hydrogenase nickel incorporation protein HypB [Dehalococcoidia bacterium]|nr:hydrogenase nickel incorporation protein HypB [Dehalococcoidia bacterium]
MKINVMTDILEANDRIATDNADVFSKHRNLVLNLMSSPGAGKTTLLEKTAEALKGKLRLGVITGDVETSRDAERLQKYKLPVVQLTTGSACHLDANMITYALPHIDLKKVDILIIENVGNLVCPAGFKLGEDYKIMILSVTEGDEKPLKYPQMFRESSLLLINKIDLLEYTNFSLKEAKANVKKVNPKMDIMDISCTTGDGISEWISWLNQRYQKKFGIKTRA